MPGWKEITVGKSRQTVDLQLGKGERIRLRVVDGYKDGRPMPGVFIDCMFEQDKNSGPLMFDYASSSGTNPAYHSLTDGEGRWSRLWIPECKIPFAIEKYGYISVQKSLGPDEREQVITLRAGVWSVSGRVVDQETKAPIKQFRVTEGRAGGATSGLYAAPSTAPLPPSLPPPGVATGYSGPNETIWFESRPTVNENGEYRVSWDRPDFDRVIRIEADGYYPSSAHSLGNKEGNVVCNVELKGENITGVVRSPQGKLLADVDVVLCTPGRGFSLRDGHVGTDQYPLVTRTGANGRFSFPRKAILTCSRQCTIWVSLKSMTWQR